MKLFATALFLGTLALHGAGITVRFQPSAPEVGPFPTDFLTSSDDQQITGRRINLPLPDCAAQPSACQELGLVNQLDGFNVAPRFTIRFSGAINTNTLRDGIAVIALDNLTPDDPGVHTRGAQIRLNQLMFDPLTNTAFGEPDEVLDQHREYLLVVTDGVRDVAGDPVQPDPTFTACLATPAPDAYCNRLGQALRSVVLQGRAVSASLFTTQSVTAFLERARAVMQGSTLDLRRTGSRNVFQIAEILSITLRQQVGVNPARFDDFVVPLPSILLQHVGRIAFASFRSPSFLNQQQIIAPQPTGAPVPLPANTQEIFFHAFLPKSDRPASGYPVVIFGHGINDSRFATPTFIAASLAENGFATVAMNAVGHGLGPEGTVRILDILFQTTVLPAGGRSVDLNQDGALDSREGCLVLTPAPVGLRDCIRQTALDLTQLTRAIRSGVDLDGDGRVDLDPNRIYYAGQSLGGIYGTVLHAIEPQIRAAVLNAAGGTIVDATRLSPSFRFVARDYLARRTPPLLNRGGDFDDNYVLRDQPVRLSQVPGAIDIQEALERVEWIQMNGDPLGYASHIRASPLRGVPPRPALWQFARGDRTVPNPATSNLIRAARMRESSVVYRHDLAREVVPSLPDNPHIFLSEFRSPAGLAVALAAQSQLAGFFASNGATIPNVNPKITPVFNRDLFFIPATLPEDLGFGGAPATLTTVSAATFQGPSVASGSIASAFGTELATATRSAQTLPLATTLAGTTVQVVDSAGTSRPAPLFSVSPGQVNWLIPPETASGTAEVTVTNGDRVVSAGLVRVERVAPGIFTANQDGQGVPAAMFLRVRADGSQVFENVFNCPRGAGSCVPEPLDLGPASEQVFLILFGTGIRGRSSAASATIGGQLAEVTYAGPQNEFVGLDQANVSVPRLLIGKGAVDVVLTLDGRNSNPVRIAIR
jgi:uncharacterized protein (TIGR03437 family)